MLADMLFLSRRDLIGLGITIHDVIAVVEDALRQQSAGLVEQPHKVGLHWKATGALHGMPAYIPSQQALGIKWVASVPTNNDSDLPQTTGMVILNDPETGFPSAIMDGTWITAMRTGAVSAITAKHLAPRSVEILGLVGCGVQMRTQLMALATVLKPKQVRAYDMRPKALDAFTSQMSELLGMEIEPCGSARDAVDGADVAVSATWLMTPPVPTLKASWLKKGALALPIDVSCAWEPATYLEADKVTADLVEPLKEFAGHGFFPGGLPAFHAELHELVGGKKPGRETDDERIVALNSGMAIEDMTMAKLALDRARTRGIGTRLPFLTSREEVFQF